MGTTRNFLSTHAYAPGHIHLKLERVWWASSVTRMGGVGRRAGDITGDLSSSSGDDGVFLFAQLSGWHWSSVNPSYRHREIYRRGERRQGVKVTTPFQVTNAWTCISITTCVFRVWRLMAQKDFTFLVYVGKWVRSETPKARDYFEDLGVDKKHRMLIYWPKYTSLGSYPVPG